MKTKSIRKKHPAHEIQAVYLNETLVGRLTWIQGDNHRFDIEPTYDWSYGDPILTLSMRDFYGDMSRESFISSSRLPPFFSNLLPEGSLRDYLARKSGVKGEREFMLLKALADDLPGAIRLAPVTGPTDIPDLRLVYGTESSDDDAKRTEALRFSLAGVQLKFSAVAEASGGLTIPAHGIGGEFIIKLPSTRFDSVPENEFSMMKLADWMAIRTCEVSLCETRSIEGLPQDIPENFGKSLVVKRFDRSGEKRIHTEDFAQVFGIYPNDKYRRVSYAGIANVLMKEAGAMEVFEFIRRLTFSILIGNADMHLKNWSLLYLDPQKPVLSPAYDFVSTIGYIEDFELGLSLAKEKNMHKIDESHFRKLAVKAKLPENLVVRGMTETVERFMELWPRAKEELPLSAKLIHSIEEHQKRLPISRPRTKQIATKDNTVNKTIHKYSFSAQDDTGKAYILHVYVDILDAGTFDNPTATIEGLKSLQTSDGEPVNRLEKGRYEIVRTGQQLNSSEPDAP